jgi:hypothetical protein
LTSCVGVELCLALFDITEQYKNTRAKQATQVDSVSFKFHNFIASRELITYNSTHTFNDHAAKLIE